MVIEFQSVSAGYGKKQALDQIAVTFRRGCISLLVGPNGCGKSTLLKTADALLKPWSGRVLVDGTPLDKLTHKQLAQKVAYLPQSRSVGSITVRQLVLHGRFPYLGYPRRYRQEDIRAVEQAMEWVGIGELSGRMLPELSGGERQKAYLAMALAQGTNCILLDEPTTYLDISHQLELMALSRRLRDAGKAVVMVLHDLNLALRWGDQITLMQQGRVLDTGTPDQLCSRGEIERVFQVRMGSYSSPEAGKQYFFY